MTIPSRLGNLTLLLFSLALGSFGAPNPSSDESRPKWKLEVLDERNTKGRQPVENPPDTRFAGVEFIDESRLLVYQLNPTGELSSRTPGGSYQLLIAFYDVASGKPLASISLPAPAQPAMSAARSAVKPIAGGIVVRTGDLLHFYSRDLQEVRRLKLGDSRTGEQLVTTSLSGKTLLVNRISSGQNTFEIVDGESFETKLRWSQPPPALRHLYSISDTAIIAADNQQRSVRMSKFGSAEWRPVKTFSKIGCIETPLAATDDLVLAVACGELVAFATDGEVSFQQRPPKNEHIDSNMAISRGGKRIAVSYSRWKRKGYVLDPDYSLSATRVAVQDFSEKAPFIAANVSPLPRWNFAIALSPSGSTLAILNDRTLSVFVSGR